MTAEHKWLVKSNDSILGPFEFDLVVEKIFTGDIHLNHEIKGPFDRWCPIKDHALFAAAIEKFKSSYQGQERTILANDDRTTRTMEVTEGRTMTDPQDTMTDKLWEASQSGQGEAYAPKPRGEALSKQIYEKQTSPPFPPQSKSYRGPQHQRPQPKSSSIHLWFLFLVVAVGVGGYFMYQFKESQSMEERNRVYARLTDRAVEALKVGEYQKALKNFSMAYNLSPQDINLLIEMAPLSIQFNGQLQKTQALLESMLINHPQKTISKLGRNIMGLSYSYGGQYPEALAYYDQSLSLDDGFLPALLNKAFALIRMEKFDEAVFLMKEVVDTHPDEAMAQYLYIRALAEESLATKNPETLEQLQVMVQEFGQRFTDFRQEVFFLLAVTYGQMGRNMKTLEDLVDQFLQVDTELTRLHVHNVSVDFQSFNWLDYFPYCQKLQSKLNSYQAHRVKGLCLLKVHRPLEAKKVLEKLVLQNNKDGLAQSLYVASLLSLQNISQAKNHFEFIHQIEPKKPLVETLLRGCLKAGDWNCADNIFRRYAAHHLSPLYYHWTMAELNFPQNFNKIKRAVISGLEISPDFAPLLKIKRKL